MNGDGIHAKALQNLAAADVLATTHRDAAASRYYWAAFLGCIHVLETAHGKEPGAFRSGATTWDHTMVATNLRVLLPPGAFRQLRDDCLFLKAMREKADYWPDPILPGQVAALAKATQRLHKAIRI